MVEGRAWIEDTNGAQLERCFEMLQDEGCLSSKDGMLYKLTSKGCERLEQLLGMNGNSSQVFVAMWFGNDVSNAYLEGIAPAIRDAGYEPIRIDKKEHSNKIDDEIIAEIRRSRFVVADFTSAFAIGTTSPTLIARGGVYYEAGFAQGLGLPVIWTCRTDCIGHIHFDTRQFAHIVWETPADLKDQLTKRIGAVIGWGARAKL